jgi:hypothetical protein
MQGFRFCWGPEVTRTYDFGWDIIKHTSYVVITAAEGSERFEDGAVIPDTESPHRFVGDARITVDSIAPHDGGVTFHVTIDWPDPLILWTDIIVFDDIKDNGSDVQRRG